MTFVALMYHNLEAEPRHEYAIRPAVFARQLAWLADEGFVVEGFRELDERLARPDAFPRRYCVLTFDDGHASNLRAARMVREAGFQATFFITRDVTRGCEGFLDEDGVRELGELCSLGSHGVTHRSLLKLGRDEVRWELEESRRWLEDLSGGPVPWFSAPGGDIDARVERIARSLGFTLLGNSIEWWNRPERVTRTGVVHRTMVYASYGTREFERILRQERRFFLRRRLRSAVVQTGKRWLPERTALRLARLKRRWLGR